MDNVDKSRRYKQTNLCEKCGEEYSVTYKRCPFCGGAPVRKPSSIDIQGPDLYDQPPVTVRPSVPTPSSPPASVGPSDEFILDLDIDFTPELEDETSSVPKPAPGAVGGKRLAGKGGRPQRTASSTPAKPASGGKPQPQQKQGGGGGGLRVFLIILSLLIIVAAGYIVATKAAPMIQTILENREQRQEGEEQTPNGETPPPNPDENFSLTELHVTLTAPGATKQLIPVFEPVEAVGALRWSSSDPSVVTVSEDGKLTAIGVGTATVTVSRQNDTTAECAVICSWDDESILENLTLNKTDFTLRPSDPAVQMRILGIEGTPPEIIWESANPAIAAITEAGLVSWVAPGATKITATINGSLVLTCDVHCR